MSVVNPLFAQFEKQWNLGLNPNHRSRKKKTDRRDLRTTVLQRNFTAKFLHPSTAAARKLRIAEAKRIKRAYALKLIRQRCDAESVYYYRVDKYSPSQSAHSVPAMPMELFRKDSDLRRRIFFFKHLRRGDLLYLQVINDTLSDSYKLWVLAKEQECVKLDDLLVVVYLPKFTGDLKHIDGDLKNRDLIRAALCSCCIRERKLYVSLDASFLEEKQKLAKLGRVTYTDLPHHLGKDKPAASYVKYIKESEDFRSAEWLMRLREDGLFNTNRKVTFFKGLEGKNYPDHEYASYIKKKHAEKKSSRCYLYAIHLHEAGYYDEALDYINMALTIYPDNIFALLCRGTLYANENCLRRAFIDTESALRLDPSYDPARKQMSVLLVAAARTHLEQDCISKAEESLEKATLFDENNPELNDAKWEFKMKVKGFKPATDTIFCTTSFRRTFRTPHSRRSYLLPPIKIPVHGAFPSPESSHVSSSNSDRLFREKKRKMKKHHRKRSKHHHHHHRRHRRHHHKYKSRSRSPRRRRD